MEFLKTKILAAKILLVAMAIPSLGAPSPPAVAEGEYALKAVFVFNFLRFIDWPATAFSTPEEPIVIGIIGEDPFGPLLRETVKGESLRGRTIRIDHYRSMKEISKCHLLFVSRSENKRAGEIIAAVSGKSIVTVGESESFLDRGGMIALTADHNRVRLTINSKTLQAASLDVSSKLLRVAQIRH